MAKPKTIYICSICGAKSHKWQGKCFECDAFNSFVAETVLNQPNQNNVSVQAQTVQSQVLSSVLSQHSKRTSTGIASIDELLAGGFVTGQTILLGGEPGIGKSTLLLQLAEHHSTFYIAGEESVEQIKLRAERIGVSGSKIEVIDERDVDVIIEHFRTLETTPPVIIVDSIQSVFSSQIKSVAGSIAQVQYCASMLNNYAKKSGSVLVLVGQVTKSGYLAGPKLLEHLVDTVLYFEGDKRGEIRILRVVKNRFGPSHWLELYQMTQEGLQPADSLLERLIEERSEGVTGTVLGVAMEGNRPLIVEIQALSVPSKFSNPRRVINGYSIKRVEMLLAVIARRVGVQTMEHDLYINISGGVKVDDPALDLPICLAVISVLKDKPIGKSTVAFGEVGLLGEVKPVSYMQVREDEVRKRNYSPVISPNTGKSIQNIVRGANLIG